MNCWPFFKVLLKNFCRCVTFQKLPLLYMFLVYLFLPFYPKHTPTFSLPVLPGSSSLSGCSHMHWSPHASCGFASQKFASVLSASFRKAILGEKKKIIDFRVQCCQKDSAPKSFIIWALTFRSIIYFLKLIFACTWDKSLGFLNSALTSGYRIIPSAICSKDDLSSLNCL